MLVFLHCTASRLWALLGHCNLLGSDIFHPFADVDLHEAHHDSDGHGHDAGWPGEKEVPAEVDFVKFPKIILRQWLEWSSIRHVSQGHEFKSR